ncbi:MAG: GPW/gp25 family protein [Polyangia bacterium]
MSFLNRFLPEQPQDDLLTSVVRNLAHLLNSRRGYGSLLCSFGLVDYLSEPDARGVALAVLREIRDDIEGYEPRLRLLDLRTLGRDEHLRMHILITGQLLGSERPERPERRSERIARAEARSAPCYLLVLFHVPTGTVEIKVCDVR